MNTKLVSSMDSIARSRRVAIGVDALLVGAAELLSTAQIGLVVVCDSVGVMAGVITKSRSR
jgi:predicted transcriptional regulator